MIVRKYDSIFFYFYYDFSDIVIYERDEDYLLDYSENGFYKEGCNLSFSYRYLEYRLIIV